MKKKEKVKRVLEIDEDEYYILKRSVDFLTSSYMSLKPSNINSKDLYALDDRLSIKFEELPELVKQ
jgi:hypothetical protein